MEATRAALWPRLGEAPGQFFQNAVASGGNGTDLSTGAGPGQGRYFLIYGLSTTGTSQLLNTPLGVNPSGHFNNAVDISAKNLLSSLQADEPRQAKHSKFRWRQTVSQKGFQKVGANWTQVFHTVGSERDDPDPQLQVYDDVRGWFRMFDSPGWPSPLVGPATRTVDLGGGVKSDAQATEVVVKMFLQTWVEGLSANGAWERVSTEVLDWCSVQWLKRTGPSANWTTTSGATLVSGGEAMRTFAKAPDDVDI